MSQFLEIIESSNFSRNNSVVTRAVWNVASSPKKCRLTILPDQKPHQTVNVMVVHE